MVDDEHIVLLDDDHKPIGIAPKLESHHAKTPLHLAFSCYVFNEKGQFLLTQRALSKKVWPGVWTNSACGHPKSGEKMEDAISRRLDYELGMKAKDFKLILPDYRYKTDPFNGIIENELCPVYIARTTEEPNPNPKEVESFRWVSWSSLKLEIKENPEGFSYWFKEQVELIDHEVKSNVVGVLGFEPRTNQL